ncbi:MAG: hypothetical protein Q4A17_15730, partial [Thermoguttaceae bacterium]|nr:hypothetical protein [Thermoguttaceae bacterium]
MPSSFPQKVVHYTRALARWIKAGRPVRNEAEILHILNTFCLSCESYDPQRSTCLHCGCRVNTSLLHIPPRQLIPSCIFL